MDFKAGDRVRWKAFPGYGVGTVLDSHYDPLSHHRRAIVRFDGYGKYVDESDYHTPEIEELELAETGGSHEPFVEAVKNPKFEDDVNHPAHYNSGRIEVWDFIYDQGLGYALGNATKYITRAGKKAGNSKTKDLRKAIAFLEREIRFEETGE